MRGGEGTEEERASLPGCAVGCVARVRRLIYIDTAVEELLMIDDVLRCGQYELDRHDLHALERLRLRLRDGGDAMRCDGHARYHRTRWRCGGGEGARHGDSRLDRLESRSTFTHARAAVVLARRRGPSRTAGWQRRRIDWSRYGWWCAVVIEHTSLSLAGWTPALIRERSFETRDALFAGWPSG